MRKYGRELEAKSKEMYESILSCVKLKAGGELDSEHYIILDDDISVDNGFVESINTMVFDEDGDFNLYDGDYEGGSFFDANIDVQAEIADCILDGNFEYVTEDEL
jgi:hypothetical protein